MQMLRQKRQTVGKDKGARSGHGPDHQGCDVADARLYLPADAYLADCPEKQPGYDAGLDDQGTAGQQQRMAADAVHNRRQQGQQAALDYQLRQRMEELGALFTASMLLS